MEYSKQLMGIASEDEIFIEVGGGRERGRRRSSGSPAVANGGGAAPAALGGGELAVEIKRTTRKLVWGLI